MLLKVCVLSAAAAAPADGGDISHDDVRERLTQLTHIRELRVEAITIPALPGYRTYRGEPTREEQLANRAQQEFWKRRAMLVPLSPEDRSLVINVLSHELSKEHPSWPLIQETLSTAESGAAGADDMVTLLGELILFPRGEKIEQAHAQSLLLAMSTAGFIGTDVSLSLLSEATKVDFWLEAGPVRTDLVGLSENSEQSVGRLRVEAVQAFANSDSASARDALLTLLGHTPPLDTFLEAVVNRILSELDARAEVSLPASRDEPPRGEGLAWERLTAIVDANDAHINEVSETMRERILTGNIDSGIVSQFRQQIWDARHRQTEEGEIALIRRTLEQEIERSTPEWTLLREAILALRHLHVEDDGIIDSLRAMVAYPRTHPIPNAQLDSIHYAIPVIGRIGTEKAVSLLEEMTTQDFWESGGPLDIPPSQRRLRDGDPVELMRLNAISALGAAQPEFARPVLRRIAEEYRRYRNVHSATGEMTFEYLVNPRIDWALHHLGREIEGD